MAGAFSQPGTEPAQLQEYIPSGGTSPLRSLLSQVAAVLAGAVVGLVYTLVVFHLPFLKLRFVATFGAGFALGGLVLAILHLGQVRSRPIALFVALLAAGAAYYVSWATWLALAVDDPELSFVDVTWFFLTHPAAMFEIAGAIYDEGYWSHGNTGDVVAGPLLGMIWLIEAGLLFGIPLVLALRTHGQRPFCEQCSSWCTVRPAVASLGDTQDSASLRQSLLQGDLAALMKAGPADFEAPTRLRVERADCPKCGGLRCMTLWHVARVIKDGREVEKTTPIVRHLVLTEEQARWIDEDLAAASPIAPQPPAEEVDEPATASGGPPSEAPDRG